MGSSDPSSICQVAGITCTGHHTQLFAECILISVVGEAMFYGMRFSTVPSCACSKSFRSWSTSDLQVRDVQATVVTAASTETCV